MKVTFEVTYGIVRTLVATRITDRDVPNVADLMDKTATYMWTMYRGNVVDSAGADHLVIASGGILHRYGNGPLELTQRILKAYLESPAGKEDSSRGRAY